MGKPLEVEVGADTTALEKGLNDVTKAAAKGGSDATSAAGGFVSTLGKAYGIFSTIMSAITAVFDFVYKYATMAREFRNLSVATGIPVGELRKYDLIAKQAGISTTAFTHSMAEFNKNMGAAKIRGSEVNALLAKLGVGLKDISSGTFTYNDALIELAKAHEAGTDAATLMYYGTQLFGSSFEQLLPLIKQGSAQLKKEFEARNSVIGANDTASRVASNFADQMDGLGQSISNLFINIVGGIGLLGEGVLDFINNFSSRIYNRIFSDSKEESGRLFAEGVFKQMSKGLNKEQQKSYFNLYGAALNKEEKAAYDKRIKELTEAAGKKLTPLGLTEAQGASTIQQMGGGDIVSAIAFTPLERIATATEQTAKNTEKIQPAKDADPMLSSTYTNLGF